MRIGKSWTAIDMLTTIWKSDLSNKIKREFFQTVTVSILLYCFTTWILTKLAQPAGAVEYTDCISAEG